MSNQRGQSTAEYAVVISVVIACVIGMQLYVKRGMQAKLKQASDTYTTRVGENADKLVGVALEQYEPYYTGDGTMTNTYANTDVRTKTAGGKITGTDNQSTARSGSQTQKSDQGLDGSWQ